MPTMTVGSVIQELLPFGSNPMELSFGDEEPNWEIVPLWAPDLFAVVATLAERSGFYAEPGIALSTTASGRKLKRRRAAQAESMGADWGKVSIGVPSGQVLTLWERLLTAWGAPVCAGPGFGKRWKDAAMKLLATVDEACAGVGYAPDDISPDRSQTLATFVLEEYLSAVPHAPKRKSKIGFLPFLPYSLARAVPADRACVLPKALTPEVGCTLRSMTHNLSLLPGIGEVTAEWRLTSSQSAKPASIKESSPFNLLVIPYPYHINSADFSVGRAPDGSDVDGYFQLNAGWMPKGNERDQVKKIADFILALIKAAEADGGDVNAIILPESALPLAIAEKVAPAVWDKCRHLEMFITGVLSPPPARPAGGEPPFPRNEAFVARFNENGDVDQYCQAKHHRWRLDSTQIENYGLSHVLNAAKSWWEKIDLADRRMIFGLDSRQAVVAALICEDLARYDPVLPVLAAIGPNLVIALLMDGPQLGHRWPGRHATVLADDPGAAVLTVTSLGMVRRSTPPRGVSCRDCVALWTERGKPPKELDLTSGGHALFLALSAQSRKQKTLDIRSQRDSGGLIEYKLSGCREITLTDLQNFAWLK
ncbi:MAG: hypothetical protein B7Z75_13180 [Acidocella sp. 20-57-95]|nr:MAG: hypothetical protein B7Z75_13180 [Acidocella sp. 20-57-95]OYV61376.1 MAG: hypothetical protein B7Z71_04735 [Acidocella sp. 21-58-7]